MLRPTTPVYRGYQQPGTFKGTNYFPSIAWSRDTVRGLLSASGTLPGFFHARDTADEIAEIARNGLNNIRLFGSFYGWMINPPDYMRNLKTLCAVCNVAGISITYVFWTTASDKGHLSEGIAWSFPPAPAPGMPNPVLLDFVVLAANSDARSSRVPQGEPWHMTVLSEPGNLLFKLFSDHAQWPFGLGTFADSYVDSIARFFGSDPDGTSAFASYDVFNEPHIDMDADSFEATSTMLFIKNTVMRIKAMHPDAPWTIGTGAVDMDARLFRRIVALHGIAQDYLSFHVYPPEGLSFLTVLREAIRSARRVSREVVCSEFEGIFWNPYHLPQFIVDLRQATREAGGLLGAQLWGFLQSNFVTEEPSLVPRRAVEWHAPFDPFVDGVVKPILPVGQSDVAPGQGVRFTPFDREGLAAVRLWTSKMGQWHLP